MKLFQKMKRTDVMNVVENLNIQSKAIHELQVYKEIYNIETVNDKKVVTKEFFEYCESKKNFVLMLLYDNEGKVYLKENGIDAFVVLNKATILFFV